jgi:DNA polymerase-1
VLKEKQQQNGFHFNVEEANVLFTKLRQFQHEIEEKIYEYWPPKFEVVAEYKQSHKKNGEPTKNYLRHLDEYEKVELKQDGGYECFGHVYFDVGSPDQRAEKLVELGWKPGSRERTPTGKPRPTKKGKLAPTLEAFVEESGLEQVHLIVEWMNLNYLGNMINTWMEAYNEKTGAIHGRLFLANTLRYKHSAPNTANIPAVRLDDNDHPLLGKAGGYTYEARALWECRPRRKLVGVDAKGIQLRILAHYLNNEAFTAAILSSDPHKANQENMGLPSRALTKTITYATLMGAGDGRIAEEARVSLSEAKEAKKLFFEQVPELPDLIARLTYEWRKTGRITLCSGNKILVPRDYTVIPYLLQGDESQIMKQAGIYVAADVKRLGLDVLKVGDIHDELQNDVNSEHVNPFVNNVCPTAFKLAGETFNYTLPIECDAKIGNNWAETH